MNDFITVERPKASPKRNDLSPLSAAIRATATTGAAVKIAMNGETYAVVRNRLAARFQYYAKNNALSIRTAKDTDGALLVWLEPRRV